MIFLKITFGIAILACSAFGLAQCAADPQLTPVQYVNWVENPENGLRVSTAADDFVFTLQYQPIAYNVAREERQPTLSKALLEQETREREGLLYFMFRIALANGQGGSLLKYRIQEPGEFEQRIAYCASAMQQDFSLAVGTDTLPCLLFHFERTYDIAPYSTFLLGFQKPADPEQDLHLRYTDKLFGLEPVSLTIKAAALHSIPPIKTY